MEAGDAEAFLNMGTWYFSRASSPQDMDKGLELTSRAAELGSANAHFNMAVFYSDGQHAPRNAKKALFHDQQAAMRGNVLARYRLGMEEMKLRNWARPTKHWMIAAASGDKRSLDNIKVLFTKGKVTKAEYERALRAYQNYQEAVQSDQRTRALGFVRADNSLLFND